MFGPTKKMMIHFRISSKFQERKQVKGFLCELSLTSLRKLKPQITFITAGSKKHLQFFQISEQEFLQLLYTEPPFPKRAESDSIKVLEIIHFIGFNSVQ